MNNLFLFILSLLAFSNICLAQKSSKETLTIQYTVDPTIAPPEKPLTYSSVIRTTLDPLSIYEYETAAKGGGKALEDAKKTKLTELANTNLVISGSKYNAVTGIGDWLVTLETGDAKITSVIDKPLGDLAMADPIFGYTCPAKLTVNDKTGKIILEKVIAGPEEEQKMPKAALFFNVSYAAKIALAKNNPEKLKKLTDEILEHKSNLVLGFLVERAHYALTDAFELQNRTEYVSVFSVKGKAYGELNDISEKIFETVSKFRALSKKNRIPKEDVDKVMLESVPTWEKYIAGNPELEEQAKQGLILNCALATTWVGDFDKASSYFSQVPEAKPDTTPQAADDGPPSSSPTAPSLSFSQSAVNLRNTFEAFKEYKSRAKISQ